MERQERTTQQRASQQSTPSSSRWRRIRVFDRPQNGERQSPTAVIAVLVLLGLIALIAIGIIIF